MQSGKVLSSLLELVGGGVHISDGSDFPGFFVENHHKAAPHVSLGAVWIFDDVAAIDQRNLVFQESDFFHLQRTSPRIGSRTSQHAVHRFTDPRSPFAGGHQLIYIFGENRFEQ